LAKEQQALSFHFWDPLVQISVQLSLLLALLALLVQ
jgi:hypothetical protein